MPATYIGTPARLIDVKVSFQWDGANWVDETTNLIKISGNLETVQFNEAFQVGRQVIQQMTITLANADQRYSFYNNNSPLYAYIVNAGTYRKRCKIEIQEEGGAWQAFFLGYIKIPKESLHNAQIVFNVWDAGEFLRQRYSTAIYLDKLEHEIVVTYLQLAGLVDGTDFVSPEYAAAHGVDATIDYSSIVVPYSWLDDEQIWDELVDIAQASGARIYVGKDGRIYYEKAWRWAAPYLPAVAITVSGYGELSPSYDDKTFYDEVLVGYAPRVPGETDYELWKMQHNKLILPGATENISARLRYPALSINPPVANTDYYLRSLGGADLSGSCTVAITYYAQQVKIDVTNNSAQSVTLGNFTLKGQPLVGQPSEQVRREIESPEHARRLEVRDNPYLMSEAQATSVAETLKWWCKIPKVLIQTGKMMGDPSIRLGQKATVSGPNLIFSGIIVRIVNTIDVPKKNVIKFSQDLTVIQNVFAPANDYFILGTDTLGSNKALWV